MDVSLQGTKDGLLPGINEVLSICKLLEEHKGGNVAALDLRELHLWTDFFIIATVSSSTHLQGLLRHIKEHADEQGLAIQHSSRKERSTANDSPHAVNGSHSGWNLVDMGTVVIHLMTAQSRDFYELEELWSSAGQVYPA